MTLDDQARIVADLQALSVRAGDVLLVHSSLRSLGHVEGGATTVIAALLEAMGPSGTLLMPCLSYTTVHAQQPVFELENTPCCVGTIPETFRCWPGVLRSIHPTHSVCGLGPQAHALLAHHHEDTTPCGPRSPYRLLREAGGRVLMLGCSTRCNTSMHGVEELLDPPRMLGDALAYQIILPDRSMMLMNVRRHAFQGWDQRYDRLEPLLKAPELLEGQVLAARCHLIDARAMWRQGLAALQQDPWFFVQKKPA